MRKLKENLLKSLIYLSAFFTVSMLVVIVGYIFIKGIGGVNLSFLTSDYSADGSGGILPMIVTTVYTVILSIAIATPIGILSAIYLQEYAKKGKVVNAIRFATESLAGNILRSSFKFKIFNIIRSSYRSDNNTTSNNKNNRRSFKNSSRWIQRSIFSFRFN